MTKIVELPVVGNTDYAKGRQPRVNLVQKLSGFESATWLGLVECRDIAAVVFGACGIVVVRISLGQPGEGLGFGRWFGCVRPVTLALLEI